MEFELVAPSAAYARSFLAALDEIGETGPPMRETLAGLAPEAIRADFSTLLERIALRDHLRSEYHVPGLTRWAVADGEYVGRISLRLELTGSLRKVGGNIGYEVRPSARGRGYATRMLRETLKTARDLGLERVLLTCDETNLASRKVIERCGGMAVASTPASEDCPAQRRYWIPTLPVLGDLKSEITDSVEYLSSEKASRSVSLDPYWPKWDSPWWHMVALLEVGLAHLIPEVMLDRMAQALGNHYLPLFPFREEEIPAGKDPYRHIICHCALGTLLRLLVECEHDPRRTSPWVSQWFSRYQMKDGGFNCDEGAYLRPRPVGSFVSTTPILEALMSWEREGMVFDKSITDEAARFLFDRRLFHSLRTGEVVDSKWLSPLFPRFYEYDALRGLAALSDWCDDREAWDELESLSDVIAEVDRGLQSGKVRNLLAESTILPPQRAGSPWTREASTSFPLLRALTRPGVAAPFLECQRNRVRWHQSRSGRS